MATTHHNTIRYALIGILFLLTIGFVAANDLSIDFSVNSAGIINDSYEVQALYDGNDDMREYTGGLWYSPSAEVKTDHNFNTNPSTENTPLASLPSKADGHFAAIWEFTVTSSSGDNWDAVVDSGTYIFTIQWNDGKLLFTDEDGAQGHQEIPVIGFSHAGDFPEVFGWTKNNFNDNTPGAALDEVWTYFHIDNVEEGSLTGKTGTFAVVAIDEENVMGFDSLDSNTAGIDPEAGGEWATFLGTPSSTGVLNAESAIQISGWEYTNPAYINEQASTNFTITNNAPVEVSADLVYYFDEEATSQTNSFTVPIGVSSTESDVLTVSNPPGVFTHSLRLANGEILASGEIEVLPNIKVTEWNIPEEVVVGDLINTSITLETALEGTSFDGTIQYYFDGKATKSSQLRAELTAFTGDTIEANNVEVTEPNGTFTHSIRYEWEDNGQTHSYVLDEKTITVLSPAKFEVTEWNYNDPVVIGEEETATVTITNTGQAPGTHTLVYYFDEKATSISSGEITINGLANTTIPITTTVTEPNGTFNHSIRYENETILKQEEITVWTPANITVTNWDVPSIVVVGQEVTSTIDILNTGQATFEGDLAYFFNNTETGMRDEDVTLAGGESAIVSRTYPVTPPTGLATHSIRYLNGTPGGQNLSVRDVIVYPEDQTVFDVCAYNGLVDLQTYINEVPAGSTLNICNGTYDAIEITQPINLVGESRDGVTIDEITSIGVSDISIRNVTIESTSCIEFIGSSEVVPPEYYLSIKDADNVSVSQVTIREVPLLLEGDVDTQFFHNHNGVNLENVQNVSLTDVVVTNTNQALQLRGVINATLTKISTNNNNAGIDIRSTNQGQSKNISLLNSSIQEIPGVTTWEMDTQPLLNVFFEGYDFKTIQQDSGEISTKYFKTLANALEHKSTGSTIYLAETEFIGEGYTITLDTFTEVQNETLLQGEGALEVEIIENSELSISGYNVRAALVFGVHGTTLNFSNPVRIEIQVPTNLNGQTLDLYRSTNTNTGWTQEGLQNLTCVVQEGMCVFETTKASYFAGAQPTPPPQSSGGGGSVAGQINTGYWSGETQEEESEEEASQEETQQTPSDESETSEVTLPEEEEEASQQEQTDTQDTQQDQQAGAQGNFLTGAAIGALQENPGWSILAVIALVMAIAGVSLLARKP